MRVVVRWGCWVLLVMAVAVLARRTVATMWAADRFFNGCDAAAVYTATRVALAGGNPYDQAEIDRLWAIRGNGQGPATPSARRTPSVYPPGTLLLAAPVATIGDWVRVRRVWVVANGLCVAVLAASLPGLAGRRWTDPLAVGLVAAALAQQTVGIGLLLGQPAVAATTLVVLAARAAGTRRDGWAGAALGLAAAIKPPLVGGVVGYYLLRRRWRLAAIAVAVPVAVNVAGGAYLTARGVPWASSLASNLRAAAQPGAVNDAGPTGRQRFELVNVQVILTSVTRSPGVVSAVTAALAVGGAGAFAAAVVARRGDDLPAPSAERAGLPARGLAELAFAGTFVLLPLYHRAYDAGLLVFTLAWAAAAAAVGRWWRAAVAVGLLTAPFVYNLADRLYPSPDFTIGPVQPLPPPVPSVGLAVGYLSIRVWSLLAECGLLLAVLWWPAARGGSDPLAAGNR